MIRFFSILAISSIVIVAACGGTSSDFSENVPTNSPPIVSRVDPTDAMAGDEITIFGFGFSLATPENIVMIGDVSTAATAYSLLDSPTSTEIESLTATIPDDVTAGENSVIVLVDGHVSNGDITITVTE